MTASGRRALADWLDDIVRWSGKLERHIAAMTLETFAADEKTVDAASKCVEAVGSAAAEILKIEPHIDIDHPELNLKGAYGARNRLAHGYYAIDVVVLWSTCTISIPRTAAAAASLLRRGS